MKKWIIFGFLIVLGVPIFLGGGWVLKFVLQHRDHVERLEKVTEQFVEFDESDWNLLYLACIRLYQDRKEENENVRVSDEDLPETIRSLRPYHIWVHEYGVDMTWTGGFDNFSLYLSAVAAPQVPVGGGNPRARGIWIIDTRYEPSEALKYEPETDG